MPIKSTIHKRFRSYREHVKINALKITREQTGNWKREQGKTIMENWLTSGQEIDGVASNNDEMCIAGHQSCRKTRQDSCWRHGWQP
jgi:ABC-type sugar transport system substrate-binding protein